MRVVARKRKGHRIGRTGRKRGGQSGGGGVDMKGGQGEESWKESVQGKGRSRVEQ